VFRCLGGWEEGDELDWIGADWFIGLYTDESPGLKVDPVVVMTLSVVFIFSVVALHGMFSSLESLEQATDICCSDCQGDAEVLVINDFPVIWSGGQRAGGWLNGGSGCETNRHPYSRWLPDESWGARDVGFERTSIWPIARCQKQNTLFH
jgi:hypothetical protein